MAMKIKLFIFAVFACLMVQGQSPSLFIKMATTATAYGQNLPVGTLLFDRQSLKRYITLTPLLATKSISTSNKLLLDNISIDRPLGGSDGAEIKEIGTNSSSHYIGEKIASDGGSGPVDGIVVSIWTQDGLEKCLLAALADGSPTAVSYAAATSAIPAGWHLPTIWELTACFNNTLVINTILGSNGFKGQVYWSSTDYSDPLFSITKHFSLGSVDPYEKAVDLYYYRYVIIH